MSKLELYGITEEEARSANKIINKMIAKELLKSVQAFEISGVFGMYESTKLLNRLIEVSAELAIIEGN